MHTTNILLAHSVRSTLPIILNVSIFVMHNSYSEHLSLFVHINEALLSCSDGTETWSPVCIEKHDDRGRYKQAACLKSVKQTERVLQNVYLIICADVLFVDLIPSLPVTA